eukprot:215069-Alexandrium_andersonii.AAC.1
MRMHQCGRIRADPPMGRAGSRGATRNVAPLGFGLAAGGPQFLSVQGRDSDRSHLQLGVGHRLKFQPR